MAVDLPALARGDVLALGIRPADVQRLLPARLDVHTHDGVAWVGLTPFLLCDFRPPGLPAIPGLSSFPETN
ncbi:MAG: DUF2071 domain-containing protein, partial [Actinobacteria bacterium]|nr:DUF2071 domain-containing protein [Actinomycetota bacterium]